jgi:hypothetical protein
MDNKLKCPFKSKDRSEECDRDKCVLWHEGGCAFVVIAVALRDLHQSFKEQQTIKF